MISIVAADGVIRERLPDEALLVFLSDTHIGGSSGSDIFESAAELTMLLEDLHDHEGPVELVLAGDFLDLLRMQDAGGGDPVAATLARPEYCELFATLRAFAAAEGHRVVYVVGNHDAAVWWNPHIRRTLQEAGLVDMVGLSYAASFASLPDQLIYCEHGNQFDPASAITDYANPLDTPVGAHVLAEMVRPIGSGAVAIGGVDLREVRYVFPLAAIPQWIAGRIFYQFLGQVLRWLLAPLIVAFAGYEALAAVVPPFGRSLGLRPLFLELASTSSACWWWRSRCCSSSVAGQPPVQCPRCPRVIRGRRLARNPTGRTWPSGGSWSRISRRPWPGPPPDSSWPCSSPATPMPRRSRRSCVPRGGRR
jgi:3',5'-cyclic AMP phosphodiesterase CpdA